ncbi:MAG TPA: PAS domain S-box protein, partial [Campylobacterales bacterium]|nr:PAS domain S-box protein [Campylobacterales bacterium]
MRSIRSKLIFILSLSALLSIALESMALFIYKYNQSRPQAVSILSDMAAVMSENLTASLEFDDEASAKSILAAFKNSGRIDGAYLLKKDGSILAKYEKEGANKELISKKAKPFFENLSTNSETSSFDFNSILLAKQIILNGKQIGSVVIVSNTKEMKESLYTQLFMQTTTSLIALILMILLAFRLQKAFTDPIYTLKNAFDTVRLKNDYSAKIDLKTNDEFQSLFDGFGKMLETIKDQKAKLEVYTESLNETIALKTADIQNQKAKLERLLETLDKNVIFSRTDLDGVIVQVSDAFCKISGYSKEELIGKPHSIVKHPDTPISVYAELWNTLKAGKIWHGEVKNQKKDGGYYWIKTIITPEYDNFGSQVGFSAIQQDITAKKREEVERILENILLPILITSRTERKILYANRYAEVQYDRPLKELIGADIDNVYTAKGQQEQILELLSKNGRVLNLEENFKTAGGKEFTALLSVIPIVYSGIDCYIGMVTDITEQKRIENEFRILHQHTKESIEYASLLQHSLIPSSDLFKKYFSDHFVIWHPKDIVGGDIYLFDELERHNECLLFVIDCTGHGVPGAFVTMLVKAIEREIVSQINNDNTTDVSPAWILSYFNKTMKYLLRQDSDKAISNAGFDGAIIHYNKQNRVLKFAGAQTNLFYVQDGKLNTIKGDRHSIGYKKSNADFQFTEHTIQASSETRIY